MLCWKAQYYYLYSHILENHVIKYIISRYIIFSKFELFIRNSKLLKSSFIFIEIGLMFFMVFLAMTWEYKYKTYVVIRFYCIEVTCAILLHIFFWIPFEILNCLFKKFLLLKSSFFLLTWTHSIIKMFLVLSWGEK